MNTTSFLAVVSEKTTDTVTLISIIAVALAVLACAAIAVFRKGESNTKAIVYAGVCIAASFALSFIKFEFPYGGSVTVMSFVPVLVYAYFFGPVRGLIAGFVYGILQFIQSPWILTPMSFILDYLLAFSCIGLMGFASKLTKNTTANLLIGTAVTFFARLVMHVLAGIIYFKHGVVASGLPTSSAFLYSLCYNVIYISIDCALCLVAFFLLEHKKAITRLGAAMKLPRREKTENQ